MNLIEELTKVGIKAQPYKKPPMGKRIFALTIRPSPKAKEGIITVHQGEAKVEVHGSRKHKQAVVTVEEEGRKVTRHVTCNVEHTVIRPIRGDSVEALKNKASYERMLRSEFNVVMPENARWTFSNIRVSRRNWPIGNNVRGVLSGDVTAQVMTRTINHFLMGMDESHNFIAPLPKPAKSVLEAHRMLKPSKIAGGKRRNWKRQGEWFFVPCNQDEIKRIEQHIKHDNVASIRLGRSTHTAQTGIRMYLKGGSKRTVYARGYVLDRREGHHANLFLPDWHEVIRNKETTVRVHKDQIERARQSTSTWD